MAVWLSGVAAFLVVAKEYLRPAQQEAAMAGMQSASDTNMQRSTISRAEPESNAIAIREVVPKILLSADHPVSALPTPVPAPPIRHSAPGLR